MPQVFPKSANQWSKASLVGVLFLVLSLGWLILMLQRSDFVTTANTFREQPVQFSHQHHVGGIGIDCRYCHTSVEVAPSAGIPPTKTCINCHSQIWSASPYLEPVRASFRDDRPLRWIRVHDLPDFVYFNHSIHVRKGVGEAEFVKMRTERDKTLAVPQLLIPSIQVNMRAGEMPPPEDNGISYIKIPLNRI